MTQKLLFLDTETTSNKDDARLVQIAYKVLPDGKPAAATFKPPMKIDIAASAIHHITDKMVADRPSFSGSDEFKKLQGLLPDHVLIAHNAPFDMMVLKNEGLQPRQFIDTCQVARHIYPDAEQHKLQYLRYMLEIEIEASAHDALGDIMVLEQVFAKLGLKAKLDYGLMADDEVIQKMIELSVTPVLMKSFRFGKYNGKTFEEVARTDRRYLQWLHDSEMKKAEKEQNKAFLHTVCHHLGVRLAT